MPGEENLTLRNETLIWENEKGERIAQLDVNKRDMTMTLKITPLQNVDVEGEMEENDKMGLYPNNKLAKDGDGNLVFDIKCPYNWNARYRDFIRHIDKWTKANHQSFTP